MENIVEWLITIEDWASRLYEESAIYFKDDKSTYDLFNRLAVDEGMHYHFMNSALICLKSEIDLKAEILLDQQTISNVEKPLKKIENLLKSGRVEKQYILEAILANEQSEWNDIFLYVINVLTNKCSRFKVIGPSLQNHLRVIEQYFAEMTNGTDLVSELKKIPSAWKEKILIVDDSEPILELLDAVFSREGDVHIANNGEEALKMASNVYYATIISDIDMPIMNGIQFYKNIKNIYSNIGKRFIFISGRADNERMNYIENENLTFLKKPFAIQDIREAVYKIMDQNSL